MAVALGTRIGSYEIRSAIGQGGMGEVYRAVDTNLNRHLAIKVLPEAFSRDGTARLEREAKTLATLNHPNIAAIYGFENRAGSMRSSWNLWRVQRSRNAQGPIPVDEALPIATQIADGLDAAHEEGVIHRDLKPANIKITAERKVKVLDFGLAKAFAGDPAELSLSNSPTLMTGATQAGSARLPI